MCQKGDAAQIVSVPFLGLQAEVDEILETKCQKTVNMDVGPAYHQILYGWRMKRGDFRGAAAILHDRLQRLQTASRPDTDTTAITQGYLALLNTLASVDPAQAWILSNERRVDAEGTIFGSIKSQSTSAFAPKRTVVTVDQIRKEYQEELDRIGRIENNQFAFPTAATVAVDGGDDEMDVDVL